MNKPASELIALDKAGLDAAVRECARITAPEISDEEYERIVAEDSLRYRNTRLDMERTILAYLSAANQSDSERAGVDALREALEFGIWAVSGPTNEAEVERLEQIIEETWREYQAKATPPAQPAPAATHGKPDGAVRPRPSDCTNPMQCGWHHVRTEPEINMWLCSQPDCNHMMRAQAALNSAKIAAAEMSHDDVEAESSKQYRDAVDSVNRSTDREIAAAIDHIDVKAEAKSQEGATNTSPVGTKETKHEISTLDNRSLVPDSIDPGVPRRSGGGASDTSTSGATSDRLAAVCDDGDTAGPASTDGLKAKPQSVAIKPLEWSDHEGDGVQVADAVTGEYRVRCHGGEFWVVARDGIPLSSRPYELASFAKAAAQANHEQRIRSALTHPTKPEAPAVGVDAISLNGVTQVVYDHGPSFSWDECKKIAGSLLARFHITDRDARS